MCLGKKIRGSRLLSEKSGKSLFIPIDHGITLGAIDGLKIDQLRSLLTGLYNARGDVQGVIAHRGIALHLSDVFVELGIPWVMHLSASTSLGERSRKVIIASVEDALRLGADAVSVHVNLGVQAEHEMLKDLGAVAEKCLDWGMPLLAMMYVTDGINSSDEASRYHRLAHAGRVACELGADMIKLDYPGSVDGMCVIRDACSAPVFFAGGDFSADDIEALDVVEEIMNFGAEGICMGRNIFQRPDPISFVRRLSLLVHRSYQKSDQPFSLVSP